MPILGVANSSFVKLPARTVAQMARVSIIDIDMQRKCMQNEALEAVKHERCSHFFGLFSHQAYPTREDALKYAPEVQAARSWARDDRATCEYMLKLAEMLMADESFSEADRVIYVSLNDYRALA